MPAWLVAGSNIAAFDVALTNAVCGLFDVKLNPQTDEKVGDPTLGRLSLDKQFHGDIEGTSKGQMLAAATDVKNSAGYVALERVHGTLQGRTGTFALQHSGSMNRGVPLHNQTKELVLSHVERLWGHDVKLEEQAA